MYREREGGRERKRGVGDKGKYGESEKETAISWRQYENLILTSRMASIYKYMTSFNIFFSTCVTI